MNVFVAGGTGYLGSAVTAVLRADGHTVRAHMHSIASGDRLPARAGPVGGDPGDAAWLRARIDEADGVLHAASSNDATSGSFDAAFPDVALSMLARSDRPLVYNGGTWVHGSGAPINPPPKVAWRPAILPWLQTAAADDIRTVVIAQPTCTVPAPGSPQCFPALPPPAAPGLPPGVGAPGGKSLTRRCFRSGGTCGE